MKSILLCAEGKHDFGATNIWCARARDFVTTEGWLQPLIRSVLDFSPDFEIRERSSLIRLRGNPKPAHGHGDKSYLAKRTAALEGHDIVIFMVDTDSAVPQRHSEIVQEITDGFDAYSDDSVGCIACVPLSASEAWLLADHSAWQGVWGKAVDTLPDQPESIWGKRDDPAGNHPHRYFFRVCAEVSAADNTETRRMVSEALSVATLREKCPISFASFETNLLMAADV